MLSPLPSTAVFVPGRRGRHTNGKGVYVSLILEIKVHDIVKMIFFFVSINTVCSNKYCECRNFRAGLLMCKNNNHNRTNRIK